MAAWPSVATIRGQLLKQSDRKATLFAGKPTWKLKWFVLGTEAADTDTPVLAYGTEPSDPTPSRAINLKRCHVILTQEKCDDRDVITISPESGPGVMISSPHKDIVQVWYERISDIIAPTALTSTVHVEESPEVAAYSEEAASANASFTRTAPRDEANDCAAAASARARSDAYHDVNRSSSDDDSAAASSNMLSCFGVELPVHARIVAESRGASRGASEKSGAGDQPWKAVEGARIRIRVNSSVLPPPSPPAGTLAPPPAGPTALCQACHRRIPLDEIDDHAEECN